MKQRITRRAQRYPLHLIVEELNGKPAVDTFLVDISAMGARLDSPTPFAPRTQLEFLFFLPDADNITRLTGSVVWMKRVITTPGRYHLGLKFYSTCWEIDQLGRNGKI